MARRLTNDLLLALVLAQAATGLAGWALPVAQVAPLYDLHRALGVALLLVLLDRAGVQREAREVTMESVTGYRHTFRLADVSKALLSTHLGAEPLSAGHGYPLRLVVPGRRGYQWVKWIQRIDVA
jgi:DMSO/TMAO reductase YedYZ molybdopterin-dependent catalytic subunit